MDMNYGGGSSILAGIDDNNNPNSQQLGEDDEDLMDLRRGPWTVEEDHTLISYIAKHGEGRWNSLARCAGLKRTGKSCRLRWLNYLRPDVRRGNITLEEQLLILELHSRWGNRWSKIAQHLPGRTDNEIKNYWRTRVQKHAKQLKCDVNSKQFKDTMRYLWMPRLVERIQAAAATEATIDASGVPGSATTSTHNYYSLNDNYNNNNMFLGDNNNNLMTVLPSYASENSSITAASSDSFGAQVSPTVSDITDNYHVPGCYNPNPDSYFRSGNGPAGYTDSVISPLGFYNPAGFDYQSMELNNNNNNGDDSQWMEGGAIPDNLWNLEDIWLQQFTNNF